MKTLREIRDELADAHLLKHGDDKHDCVDADFEMGFDSGFKAAIEMLRSEEAMQSNCSNSEEFADYLEKMEKAE